MQSIDRAMTVAQILIESESDLSITALSQNVNCLSALYTDC